MADHANDPQDSALPEEPVHKLLAPLERFLHVEASGGVVLLLCTLTAVVLANSPLREGFLGFWKTNISIQIGTFSLLDHTLKHWINDGLMVIFFFVIGLEVKRELVLGELKDLRQAALPVAGALGGILIPASLYLALQYGQEGQDGWGIPMATDIAFVVGCFALLGPRCPSALRVMLLSLAIVDDIGAILVIAVGYTEELNWTWLIAGLAGIALIVPMQRLGVRSFAAYTVVGVLVWWAFHESGIHATIAGVIIGLLTPARPYLGVSFADTLLDRADRLFHGEAKWESQPHRAELVSKHQRLTRETVSPVEFLIYHLHPWVAFVIMPAFALANAGVPITLQDLGSSVAIAVVLGLVVGKPTGVLLFSWLAVQSRMAQLPPGVTWQHLAGGGLLTGIGFTMALFIAELALSGELLTAAKVGVLVGSFLSAVGGMLILGYAPITEEDLAEDSSGNDSSGNDSSGNDPSGNDSSEKFLPGDKLAPTGVAPGPPAENT